MTKKIAFEKKLPFPSNRSSCTDERFCLCGSAMEYDYTRPENVAQKKASSQSTIIVEEDELIQQQSQSGNGAVLQQLSAQPQSAPPPPSANP